MSSSIQLKEVGDEAPTMTPFTSEGADQTAGLASLQSPPQALRPSPSWSKDSSTIPLQLSSTPLQASAAPGWIAELPSLQSPPQRLTPSWSASGLRKYRCICSCQTSMLSPIHIVTPLGRGALCGDVGIHESATG